MARHGTSEAQRTMSKDKDKPSPWAQARPRSDRRDGSRPAPAREERSGRDERARNYIEGKDAISHPRRPHPESRAQAGDPGAAAVAAPKAPREQRLYGLNACLAAFARRPDALRKVYLTEARIPALKAVLAWCVKQRIGYRVVETADLDKLTSSRHHEGVCFDLLPPAPLALQALLDMQPHAPAPSLLLWLDGVGNPHNLGALLRSAAHFGVGGVIVPAQAGLDMSGAAARVAEGAAEIVPLVQADSAADALAALHGRGYALAATVPRDGAPLYATPLPSRLVLVFGAEGEGMSDAMVAQADLRLTIPGSGAIESLNVAASVAVLLGEYWRRVKTRAP
jgi:TrmH RNA methyltransferase